MQKQPEAVIHQKRMKKKGQKAFYNHTKLNNEKGLSS